MKILVILGVVLNIVISVHAACDVCASDEYCIDPACTCNSTLYNKTGSNPSPTIDCTHAQMSVYISKCWLERNGYNSTNIRLENGTCLAAREIVNGTALMAIHRPLSSNDCGNSVYINSTYVTYSNNLYIYALKGLTVSRVDVIMNISCMYPLLLQIALNYTVKPILGFPFANGLGVLFLCSENGTEELKSPSECGLSLTCALSEDKGTHAWSGQVVKLFVKSTELTVPGTIGALTVNMVIYKDADFSILLTEADSVYVESTLYVSVIIPSLEIEFFKIKVLDIYASASESGPTYYLLQDGCPTSGISADLMSVLNNGNSSEARFVMKVFQISGSGTVSLSAKVKLCTDDCRTDCTIKTKSISNRDQTALVSVFLTAEEKISSNSANCFSVSWTLCSIILSVHFVKLM